MKKKFLSLLLVTAFTVSMLTACGSKAQNTESNDTAGSSTANPTVTKAATDSSASTEKVTLSVLAGQSTTDAGIEDMIDKALAKKYPNVTLEWECVDWGTEFQPKMQQYMQSGLPDIMIGKAQDVKTYATQGVLGAIDSTYTDKVLDAANTNVTIDGKIYGVVYNALYQGVYYNKKMFKDNGWAVPKTLDDLQKIIDDCKAKGITPFASHMADTWSIGNVTMQFAMNDVFNKIPDWGDQFRAGKTSFSGSNEFQTAYNYNKLIYDNTFKDTFSIAQTDCDSRMVKGEAAMKVSGSWSIQNFLDVDPNFDFGIFPFPNQTGDSKLIFEPNITIMTSAASKHQDAINCVLDVLSSDKDLAVEIYNYTKTAAMLKDVSPSFTNPSQSDIDTYAANGQIVDVTLGNNQLVWGGFQEENAKDIAAWLQGDETLAQALKASDDRVDASSVK